MKLRSLPGSVSSTNNPAHGHPADRVPGAG